MCLLCTTTDGFVTSSHLLRGQGRRGNIETRNHAALSLVASCRAARLIALYDAWPTCSLREVRVAVAIAAEKCDKQQNMTSNRPCKGSDRKGNQVGRRRGDVCNTNVHTHSHRVTHGRRAYSCWRHCCMRQEHKLGSPIRLFFSYTLLKNGETVRKRKSARRRRRAWSPERDKK